MLVGGILTPSTLNQHVLRTSHQVESPVADVRRKQEPNIFFNSLTERQDNSAHISLGRDQDWDQTDPKSEEKLLRLLYRKNFRLKA